MQFFWKYIDEMAGKGIELSIILELIFYLSATLVPMVLPLAILLASIITFGNLGEHYELVALKSAGVSLRRFLTPLFIFVVFLSFVAFYFSNTVLPAATLKYGTLLYSVRKQRPALNIQENVFYDELQGYTIKIAKKAPDNMTIYDVMIWDNSLGNIGKKTIIAQKGEMYSTPNDSFLVFNLYDGWQHEDLDKPPKKDEEKKHEHVRTYFKELQVVMDISGFGFEKKDEMFFTKSPKVQSISRLKTSLDTLNIKRSKIPLDLLSRVKPFYKNTDISEDTTNVDSSFLARLDMELINAVDHPKLFKEQVRKKSNESIKSIQGYVKWEKDQYHSNSRKQSRSLIYLYNKFSLAFSCIVFLLIGAPMGAIIRKGGLGLPMVVAIIFFMLFFIFDTTGRKLAEELVIHPFHGVWLAVYILFPIAIYLTYKASNDSQIYNLDSYLKAITSVFKKLPFVKK